MNRLLLTGCAGIALAAGCGSAVAQEFQVKISGDAYFEAGYVEQDRDIAGAALRSTDFRNRFRLVVTPTAKADNGLEYGARLRLRANNADGTADGDRAFLFAQSAFGRVEAGAVTGISDQTWAGAPMDYQMLGQYDAFRSWVTNNRDILAGGSAAATETRQLYRSNNTGTKIQYFTPRFSGFQAGVGYTPRQDSRLTDVNRTKTAVTGDFQDVFEIGANYSGEISGVGVKASAAYAGGSAIDGGVVGGRDDLSTWQAGLMLSYAGVAVGGGYVWAGDSGQASGASVRDYQTWNLGVQYTNGPFVVGAHYANTQDAGVAASGARDLDAWVAGVLYTVAPGLRTGLEYTYFDADNANAVTDAEGSIVLLRSIVTF